MVNVSALIFSRNNVDDLIELVEFVYQWFNEVVIIDSSDKDLHTHMRNQLSRFSNVRVYYIVPIGFVEPLRPYGLSQLRNDWVMYLDADEKPNLRLLRDAKAIVAKAQDMKIRAFNIGRWEIGPQPLPYTRQIKLYNKAYVKYRGLLDELPEINGLTEVLSDEYSISHVHNTFHLTERPNQITAIIEAYTRYKWHSIRPFAKSPNLTRLHAYRVLEFFISVFGEDVTPPLMRIYALLSLIVNFSFARKNLHLLLLEKRNELQFYEIIYRSMKASERALARRVSRYVDQYGVVQLLGFDRSEVVERVSRHYEGRLEVVALLVHLLVRAVKHIERETANEISKRKRQTKLSRTQPWFLPHSEIKTENRVSIREEEVHSTVYGVITITHRWSFMSL